MRLVPFELAAEEVPEHRILRVFTAACHSGAAPGGGRDRAIGRERDGGDPIALERRLGILERLLRGAELLVQNLCELSEPLTLQVGRHGHVAFGDSIDDGGDRKSTRLNSSHGYISYAVFCLKKKKKHRAEKKVR